MFLSVTSSRDAITPTETVNEVLLNYKDSGLVLVYFEPYRITTLVVGPKNQDTTFSYELVPTPTHTQPPVSPAFEDSVSTDWMDRP